MNDYSTLLYYRSRLAELQQAAAEDRLAAEVLRENRAARAAARASRHRPGRGLGRLLRHAV